MFEAYIFSLQVKRDKKETKAPKVCTQEMFEPESNYV
jgi:hypothetical protein